MNNAHTFRQFDEDIAHLRQDTMKMLKLARRNTKQAISALLTGDREKAERVIAADEVVNALEVQIDQMARMMVVHHQPVASDLRIVFTTIKITTDLERISDLAVCIARVARDHQPDVAASEIAVMKPLVMNMFRMTREAFANSDPAIAAQVLAYDEHVNDSCLAVQRVLHSLMMETPARTTESLTVSNIAKRIERIGDHLKNIAQMIIYLASGQEVRHVSPDELNALLADEEDDE